MTDTQPGNRIQGHAASQAFEWLAEGWRLFRGAPKVWLLAALVCGVLMLLLLSIPKVGQLLSNFVALFLFGGLMLIARDVDEGHPPVLSRLFAVFQTQLGPVLLTTLLISLIIGLLVFAAVILFAGSTVIGSTLAQGGMKASNLMGMGLMGILLALALLVITFLFWFSPGLVMLRNAGPWQSITLSARGFLRNWGALLLLALMFFGLSIAATIPFGLGWLVLLPVTAAASYASIKDVFPLAA